MNIHTHQGKQDEEYHEESAEDSFTWDVAKTNCWHGNQREIDTLPIGQCLRVLKVVEWVPGILHLQIPSAYCMRGIIINNLLEWWRYLEEFQSYQDDKMNYSLTPL